MRRLLALLTLGLSRDLIRTWVQGLCVYWLHYSFNLLLFCRVCTIERLNEMLVSCRHEPLAVYPFDDVYVFSCLTILFSPAHFVMSIPGARPKWLLSTSCPVLYTTLYILDWLMYCN